MPILHLAWKSLLNRRLTAGLTLFSIALSVTLLIGVERVRVEARESFAITGVAWRGLQVCRTGMRQKECAHYNTVRGVSASDGV